MPIYDFECASCGPFSVMRRIADREQPSCCPDCGAQGDRVVSAPSLALMGGARRAAHATNERAAHAPRQSGDGPPLRHREKDALQPGLPGAMGHGASPSVSRTRIIHAIAGR